MARELALLAFSVEPDSPSGVKEEIINNLIEISNRDNDFNGENGPGYTRKEAIENGFEDNQAYVANLVKNECHTPEEILDKFLFEWLGIDSYYVYYDYNIIKNKKDEIVAVAIAYASGG